MTDNKASQTQREKVDPFHMVTSLRKGAEGFHHQQA